MKIGLVPKKNNISIPITFQTSLFYLFSGIALSLTLSIVVILLVRSDLKKKIKRVDLATMQTDIGEIATKEKEVNKIENKIAVYSRVFSEHQRSSSFFNFLKKETLQTTFFQSATVNARRSTVILSGQVPGFAELHQQIAVFENEPLIKTVFLSEASFNEEGSLNFVLSLEVDPEVFK